MKVKYLYEVKSPNGPWMPFWAYDSRDAKRQYCKMRGLRPSDHWTGMGMLRARKVKSNGSLAENR
ncbi:hypothetical protein [Kyrpidia spormannii]|uniref:Uncharacterized protein n=2 Tax=Kyrpidia spormannii TaxID=2055160 RepID=A0ACA8Z7R1_9BACL|nr:hypothetical protein [Kyrpidia spormannii]CAB3391623.1 conserved protein of unknown function [Kyrpidia spormannii]CAB3392535.1 conserved protein of unknown function [Kyrpidia spormannii]